MSYGIAQRAALIALMALQREVRNPELEKDFGIYLKRSQREKLRRDELIEVRKVGRANALTLTRKGWKWLENELSEPVPQRVGSAGGALYALLHALKPLADEQGGLRKLFPASASVEKPVDLPVRIRAAYGELAPRPREWVELTRLRAKLNGASKVEVDGALKRMYLNKEINLTLEENQAIATRRFVSVLPICTSSVLGDGDEEHARGARGGQSQARLYRCGCLARRHHFGKRYSSRSF